MLPRPQPDHIDSTRVVEQQRVTSGTNKSETSSTCNCRILFSFLRQSEQSGQSNNMAQATAEGQSPQSMCFAIPANPGVCPISQHQRRLACATYPVHHPSGLERSGRSDAPVTGSGKRARGRSEGAPSYRQGGGRLEGGDGWDAVVVGGGGRARGRSQAVERVRSVEHV